VGREEETERGTRSMPVWRDGGVGKKRGHPKRRGGIRASLKKADNGLQNKIFRGTLRATCEIRGGGNSTSRMTDGGGPLVIEGPEKRGNNRASHVGGVTIGNAGVNFFASPDNRGQGHFYLGEGGNPVKRVEHSKVSTRAGDPWAKIRKENAIPRRGGLHALLGGGFFVEKKRPTRGRRPER